MSTTNNITLDRAALEVRITQELQNIMQQSGYTLDTRESQFNTFIIRALTQELANIIYYGVVLYRESTLSTAQLNDTIKNWANYIAYNYTTAIPATTNILFTLPLVGQFSCTLPQYGFNFSATNVTFTTMYNTTINYSNSALNVQYVNSSNVASNIPYYIQTLNSINYANFLLPVIQLETQTVSFSVPTLMSQEFFNYTITLSNTDWQLYNITVIDSSNNSYQIVNNIYLSGPSNYVVQVDSTNNVIDLIFGNGVFGQQPSGLITCTIQVTLGSSGNVNVGTITSGDQLYSTSSLTTTSQLISYTCTNTNSVTTGQDEESISEIKQNAPIALTALNRLVSASDFENVSTIIQNTSISNPLALLKRSDIAANEITLYSTLSFMNQIIPGDTITIPISSLTTGTIIYPGQTITYNSIEYTIIPGIQLNYETNTANYFYLPNTISFLVSPVFLATGNSQTTVLLSATYDPVNNVYDIFVTIPVTNGSSWTCSVTAIYNNSYVILTQLNAATVTPSITTFEFTIPPFDLQSCNQLQVNLSLNSTLVQTVTTTPDLNFSISDYVFSQLINNNTEIQDVPVVVSSWYNSLTSLEQETFNTTLLDNFTFAVNSSSNRLMNTMISAKLARTYGQIQNMQYTQPTYYVANIVNSISLIPNTSTSYYAVSDPVSDLPSYNYSGLICFWSNGQLQTIRPSLGTPIQNMVSPAISGNTYTTGIYVTDGRRWFIPNYSLPLYIEIEIHTFRTDNVISEVQAAVLNVFSNFTINSSLYLSEIIENVQNIEGINYCRIIAPATDIIYKNVLQNMTNAQLQTFTPELLYTTASNIQVNVIYSN